MDSKQNYKKASFWQRLAAFIIDSLLLLIIFIPLNIIFAQLKVNTLLSFLELIIIASYNTFYVLRTGSTIGKRLLRLRVVSEGYGNVPPKQALLRETVGKFLSQIVSGLGFLWVLNDKRRQALHDKIAKTYVVKVDSNQNLIPDNSENVPKWSRILFFLIAIPVAVSMILGLFYAFVAKPFAVTGQAMAPAYKNGEYILAGRAASYERGDVVVFTERINGQDRTLIKRIVGLPGEIVGIKDGSVYVDGKILNESAYLPEGTKTTGGSFMKERVVRKIGDKHYFLMGDNRTESIDSRHLEFIYKEKIVGKVWTCYWNCK